MTEWVKFSDGKPTMADADYCCNLWVCGIAENTGNRTVGLVPYARAIEMHAVGAIDYWADTGLTLPEPPQ